MKVFEDQRRKLVDVYFGFVIICASVLARLPRTRSASGTSLAADDVADASLSVSLAHVFGFLVVETKLVFVERFDRNFNRAFAIGKNYGFIGNDRSEVFADGFLDAILVALLIDDALAL